MPLSVPPFITSSMPFETGQAGPDADPPILESIGRNTGDTADIGGWEWYTGFDAEAMADFLAGLDFLTTDWHADSGHSPVVTHETPASPATEVIRRNPRECLQGNHGSKRGVQESLCNDGSGLAGSSFRSPGSGSSGGSAAFLAGAGGASGNSRNVIGAGDGIGGGGGGAGGAGGGGGSAGGSNNGGGAGNNGAGNEGGDKEDGSPGGSSGTGTGNGGGIGQGGGAGAEGGNGTRDQGGNGGSEGGGAAEVRSVPEPVSLALVALGFAGMCFVRSHSRAQGASSRPIRSA